MLSLSIASSIQQGGASEPGVQPGQAGVSAKHGGAGLGWAGRGGAGRGRVGGYGRRMRNGGWYVCVMEDAGTPHGSECVRRPVAAGGALIRGLIHVVAMSEARDEGDEAMQEPDGHG